MPKLAKSILYGLVVFAVFTILATGLKYLSHNLPEKADYFGILTNNDLMLGLIVAIIVTITHEKRRKTN